MIATALDRLEAPPSSRLLGWHLLDARPGDGWIRIGFDGRKEFCNPAGFVQGGILSAMLDDTMGPAVFAMTEGRLYTATITMTVNFLAPARPGPIVGEASVTQLGKTIAFVEGRLMGEDGGVLATATTSARLVETAKAIPRLARGSRTIATPQVVTLSRVSADKSQERRRHSRNPGDSALAVTAAVLALVRVWRERRRTRRQLAAMSERELQDIGICRSDIASEIGQPFWRAFAANAVR
jgi:uncharacterized protein (TIGR00369 family)